MNFVWTKSSDAKELDELRMNFIWLVRWTPDEPNHWTSWENPMSSFPRFQIHCGLEGYSGHTTPQFDQNSELTACSLNWLSDFLEAIQLLQLPADCLRRGSWQCQWANTSGGRGVARTTAATIARVVGLFAKNSSTVQFYIILSFVLDGHYASCHVACCHGEHPR